MQHAFSDTRSDAFARMHQLNPYSEGRPEVQVLEISGSYVELLSSTPVMPGTLIQLHLQARSTFLLGEVRFCDPAGITFQVGIDIQDEYTSNSASDLTHVGQITHLVRSS
jgi:hypothetical protein